MGKASKTKNSKPNIKAYSQPKDRFGLWVTLAVVAVIAIIATIVVIATVNTNNQTNVEASTTTPQGVVNDGYVIDSAGLVITEPTPIDVTLEESEYTADTNNISMYIDYACPHCADFEAANFNQIKEWLDNGTIDTVTIHPLAFLTQYSATAANAFACTAEYAPERMLDAHEILTLNYQNALSSRDIIEAFEAEGITFTEDYVKCVRGEKYSEFVAASTERAQTGPIPASTGVTTITGTPTILVNGQRYTDNPTDPVAFAEFVTALTTATPAPVAE